MKKFTKAAALVMCAAMLLTSCAGNTDKEELERAPVVVKTQVSKKESIQKKNDFMGRVMPDSTVFIIPKVPGEVTSINVEVGEEVKKGQVLFEIDSTVDRLQLEQAAAAVEMAKAGLEQATGATYEQQLVQLEGQVHMAQSQKKWTDKTYDDYDDIYDATTENMYQQKKKMEATVKDLQKLYDGIKKLPDDMLIPDPMSPEFEDFMKNPQMPEMPKPEEGEGNDNAEGGEVKPPMPQIPDLKPAKVYKEKYAELLGEAKQGLKEIENAYDNYTVGYEAQYNQLTQGLEQVEIGLDVAEKAYDLATGDAHAEQIKSIEAQLKQAQSAYKMALQKLSYSSVTSPIDGVVEKKSIDVHGFASQNEPAFIVTDKSSVNVTFGVSAEDASNMKVGDPVTVYDQGLKYPGTIVEVSSFIDMKSGLYTIKANVVNDEGRIMSGSSVKLTAVTDRSSETVTIPADALYNNSDESYVYIEEDGIAKKVTVKTGIITDKRIEIVEGLRGGENVITTWNPGLIDGAPVKVKEGV